MTAEITTVVGQLSVKDNKWRNKAPNQVAVREPQSEDAPGAGKGDLFIITEIQGRVAKQDALEQQLAHTIRDTYYLSRGSITASLRRAMQAGSDLLYEHNQQHKAKGQVTGGAVVLVIYNQDAFVAQLGPAAFFAVLGDHIRRYPAKSAWLDNATGPAPDEDTPALGTASVIEPNLHHLRIHAQDKLVLADSRLAGQLPLRELVRAVDPVHIKAATKNLAGIAQAPTCSAIILEVVDAKATAIGSIKIPTPSLAAAPQLSNLFKWRKTQPAGKPATAAVGTTAGSSPATAVMELEPALETGSHKSTVFSSTSVMQKPLQWLGALVPNAEPPPPPSPEFYADDETYYPPAAEDDRPEMEAHSVAPEVTYRPAMPNDNQTGTSSSPVQKIAKGIMMGVLTIIALLAKAVKGIFGIFVPGGDSDHRPRQAGAQAQHQARSASTLKLLRNIAIIIPVLVILVVTISYLQKGRIREAEYNEFVTTAQQKFEQAQAVDTTAALGLMTEAETLLVQAEEIKQEQPEIAELRQQMAAHTDKIGNVQRLYLMPQLRQYSDAGTNTQRVIIQGLDVYVMDAGNDRIFHHQLDDLGEALQPDDEASVIITARGQTIKDIDVGDLLDITWMPTGGNRQTSDLVILNSTGLLEYNPNWGITTSALAAGETLVLPAAVDSFFGNFYVLDPQASKLLRYLPTNDGYSAAPESYFAAETNVDLTNAVDLAIDGAVYMLHKDGRLTKYLSGLPVEEFSVTGLDIPFKNPVSIFTAPDEEVQHLYVADAGNQRVVQLNKDGSFVRQFKPPVGEAVSFANLQDIYVDEIGGRMYILDSNNLYLTTIPASEAAEITP